MAHGVFEQIGIRRHLPRPLPVIKENNFEILALAHFNFKLVLCCCGIIAMCQIPLGTATAYALEVHLISCCLLHRLKFSTVYPAWWRHKPRSQTAICRTSRQQLLDPIPGDEKRDAHIKDARNFVRGPLILPAYLFSVCWSTAPARPAFSDDGNLIWCNRRVLRN